MGVLMLQILTFAIIFGIMMYIWSFVYLNKSDNKINQAFLYFLSMILLWMVLSVGNNYSDSTALALVIKTIYWYSMLSMSLFFLFFIYRFIKKKVDRVFYILVAINTITIFSRYLYPMDYTNPTFWRLSQPVVAPAMSAIFSVPAIYALFLVFQHYRVTKDNQQKVQLRYIFVGIAQACLVSVLSEYILPTWFNINTHLSLMYFAILLFVISVFSSIMKHRLFNIEAEYIFRKLFLSSSDGILIINRNFRVICVNDVAKEILHNKSIDSGDKITDYITEYDFEMNYKQHEMTLTLEKQTFYFSVTQHPIDPDDHESAKLVTITDITASKMKINEEKDMLIKKSLIDQLTGLYNKQYLYDSYYKYDQFEADFKIILMFIDVDGFKLINDLHGHLVGDKILKTVANCIRDNINSNAKAFRFGGDEFIVIFENTKTDDAYMIAERIRSRASALEFTQHDIDLKLSLSIGLVEGNPPIKDLIVKADMAMYDSKIGGKNRTTIFTAR
jgi:diguanylate cyclase (GGDEF) domain